MAEGEYSPGPHEDPDLWHSIVIGPYVFPVDLDYGCVTVEVETSVDLAQEKKKGANGARTKVKGKNISKVRLKFAYTRRIYSASNSLRLALDPGGPNFGRPWEIRHPECADRGVDTITIKSMSKLDIAGDTFSFSVEADGWTEPKTAAIGGVTTPKEPAPGWEQMSVPVGSIWSVVNGWAEFAQGAAKNPPVFKPLPQQQTPPFNGPDTKP
jgi:hypothetical protein